MNGTLRGVAEVGHNFAPQIAEKIFWDPVSEVAQEEAGAILVAGARQRSLGRI